MSLHTPTLFAVMISVSALLAAVIAFVGHRRHPDRFYWAGALALQALAYVLLALRGKIPDWWSIVPGNVAVSTSFALYALGLLRFSNVQWPALWIWAPVGMAAIVFTVLVNDMPARLIFGAVLFGLQNGLLLAILCHRRQEPPTRGQWLLVAGAVIMVSLMLMRIWAVLAGQLRIVFVTDGGWIQGVTFLAGVCATLLFSLGLVVMSEERAEQSLLDSERYQMFRNSVLERLADGAPLQQLLDAVVRGIESLHPKMMCSILLLDKQGQHLTVGSAPSLPAFYNAAVQGLAIGPTAGSCGSAVYLGQRVVVSDIATHPNWAPFREVAERAGLGACWSQPIFSSDQRVLGTFAIYHRRPHTPSLQDIELIEQSAVLAGIAIERSTAAQQVLERERHYRLLIETANEGIAVFQDGLLRFGNPRFFEMCGYRAEEIVNHPFADLIDPDDRARAVDAYRQPRDRVSTGEQVPLRVITRHRGTRWFEVNGAPFEWQGQPATLSFMIDVTERRQLEETIQQQAFHDSLTQLPNRRLLINHLQRAMAGHRRNGRYGALMFLDLDNFKPLNDTHGHGVGDQLLVEVARRLRQSVREIDTVARFGGDEFVVLLSDVHSEAETTRSHATTVAQKLLSTLAEPYVLHKESPEAVNQEVTHHCTASIGVIVFDGSQTDADELIRQADMAMYAAKQAGRNTYCFGPVTPA